MARWAAEIVEQMRRQGAAYNPPQVVLADVASVSPLQIKINDQVISKNIYLPSEMLYQAYPDGAIAALFAGHHEPDALFDFLIAWHDKAKLKPGDQLAVIQVDVSFVVLSKVVKAT